MKKCSECKIKYPEELLSPLIGSDGVTGDICGICALEISNETLGIQRDHFTGTIAEEMRKDAIAWRKNKKQIHS